MSAGQERYYTDLARDDYYLKGGEPPGRWWGSGADALGLSGEVQTDHLASILSGRDAEGQPLVQLQNYKDGRERQAGWDLTFSAPKSVSALWATAPEETRHTIQEAQQAAVEKALGYLEEVAAVTRRGKGGEMREEVGLVVAMFEHGTSRAQEPQLHTHCLVSNLGVRADDTTGSIESHPLYLEKMAAGALYRAELAHQLTKELGVELQEDRAFFMVKGVPSSLTEDWSSRAREIDRLMAEYGTESPIVAERLALQSRDTKEHIPREELVTRWATTAEEHGFTRDAARELTYVAEPRQLSPREFQDVVDKAIGTVTEKQATFFERDILRATAEALQAVGASSLDIIEAVRERLWSDPGVLRIGERTDGLLYTTEHMVGLENALRNTAEAMVEREGHRVPADIIEAAKAAKPTLTEEQLAALDHLTKPNDLVVVEGMAGTGKTYLLDAARDAWEDAGYKVIGVTLAGKAAEELAQGANIEDARTLMSYFLRREKDHDNPTPLIDGRTVVVLDEAGMVGTKHMNWLLEDCAAEGAKVVMVGDSKQLQPIDAGGPFRFLAETHGAVELTNITRQYELWMQDAVHQMAAGDAEAALTQYALAERLHLADNRERAREALVAAWQEKRTDDLKDTLILVTTNADAKDLNERCQNARLAAGEVSDRVSFIHNEERFLEGDRLLFRKNDRELEVRNGYLGTIERIEDGWLGLTVTVRLDRPLADGTERVTFKPADYEEFSLGYAVTTHKAQGATVERAFVLIGEGMQDREMSYVQLSRAREATHLFAAPGETSEDVEALVRAVERARQKELAIEELRRVDQRQQQHGLSLNLKHEL